MKLGARFEAAGQFSLLVGEPRQVLSSEVTISIARE